MWRERRVKVAVKVALNAKRPDIRVFSQSGRRLVVQCGGALSSPRRGGARPSVLQGCS